MICRVKWCRGEHDRERYADTEWREEELKKRFSKKIEFDKDALTNAVRYLAKNYRFEEQLMSCSTGRIERTIPLVCRNFSIEQVNICLHCIRKFKIDQFDSEVKNH